MKKRNQIKSMLKDTFYWGEFGTSLDEQISATREFRMTIRKTIEPLQIRKLNSAVTSAIKNYIEDLD